MSVEENKRVVVRTFEEAFNQGNVDLLDELIVSGGSDHQHPNEPSFREHLKNVVRALRTAFPDLHFEISKMIGEDHWVALHSVMTGTNLGPIRYPILPANGPREVPPTGRPIRVPHMHLIRFENGQGAELWHLMDTFAMLGQLGVLPAPQPAHA
jgi:predicted ester cyclase